MDKQRTITTTGLVKFCGIKYTRLHVWLERNILELDNPLPGAGHTGQFNFDDVVAAKVTTDLMRMCGNFDIARKAVKLLREQPRYRDSFNIIVSSSQTIEDGKIKEEYEVSWGSYREENKTDIIFYNIDSEKVQKSIVYVPVPLIMKDVKRFFEGLEVKEKQAV